MESRKVLVSFETPNGEKRKVVVVLPPRKSVVGADIWVVKKCFLHQLALENRIHELGVSSVTLDQLDIYIYDEDFEELVCMNETIVIKHLEKTLMAKVVQVCVEHGNSSSIGSQHTFTELGVATHSTYGYLPNSGNAISIPQQEVPSPKVPSCQESSTCSFQSMDKYAAEVEVAACETFGFLPHIEKVVSIPQTTNLESSTSFFESQGFISSQSQCYDLKASESHQPVCSQTESIVDDSSLAEPGFFNSAQVELPSNQKLSAISYDAGSNGTGGTMDKSTTPFSDAGNGENFELQGANDNLGKTPRELLPLSIPSYGPNPWEFDIVLRNAIEKKNFDRLENKFTRVCARHLINLRPDGRSKADYTQYSKMIVDKFPHFKHESTDIHYWSIFKDKLLRTIRNRSQASKRKSNGMKETARLKAKKIKEDNALSKKSREKGDICRVFTRQSSP